MFVPLSVQDHLDRAVAVDGDRVGIVDEREQPASSSGELTRRRLRELVVIEEYWQPPDATAEGIRDGWFHTGDGGSVDERQVH